MIKRFVNLLGAMVLLSCASAPPIQYYVLEAVTPRTAPALGMAHKAYAVGIGPITVPSLLDRKKIVTRTAGNQVQIAEFHQWAMPLQDNIGDTLVNNLGRLDSGRLFRVYPWSVYGVVDIQVIIDIQRFDATPGKSVNLEANWTIKNEKTQTLLKNGRSVLEQPLAGSGYAEIAKGLSQLVSLFSQELHSAMLSSDSATQ